MCSGIFFRNFMLPQAAEAAKKVSIIMAVRVVL